MRNQGNAAEILRLRDEAIRMCEEAATVARAVIALTEELLEDAPVPSRGGHRKPGRPRHLHVVPGIAVAVAGVLWRGLHRPAAAAGMVAVTAAAVTAFKVMPYITPAPVPLHHPVPVVLHARRRTDPAPAASPSPVPDPAAVPAVPMSDPSPAPSPAGHPLRGILHSLRPNPSPTKSPGCQGVVILGACLP